MKKGKAIILIILMAMAVIGATAVLVMKHNSYAKVAFHNTGYILEADAEARSQKIRVDAGSVYEKKAVSDELVFKDVTGSKQTLALDTFVHYDTGEILATSESVLLNLDDLSGNFINHYTADADMLMRENNNKFLMESDGVSLEFDEFIWKLTDYNYLIGSPDIELHFSEDDVRDVGKFLQVRYIDGSVVQMLTEENVWHTISPEVYAETSKGAKVYLARQLVDMDGNQLFLSKLTHSADALVMLPKEETNNLAVPEISIQAVDGKDGEDGTDGTDGSAGTDGISGTNGIDGTQGEEGMQGDDGESGEDASSGSNGSTGAAGSNGNSGSSGDSGDSGYKGNKGEGGIGVDGDSSSKTALPVMTFSDWEISGTSVRGTVVVEDERGILSANTGAITVFNMATEEEKPAFVVDDGTMTEDKVFDFSTLDAEGYSFGIDGLKPDSEYKILVTSEYKMADNSGVEHTYRRDFVIRSFYTDSLGVYMEVGEVNTDSINFEVIKQNYSNAVTAGIYLLSKEQYEENGFDFDTANSSGYMKQELDISSGSVTSDDFTQVKTSTGQIPIISNKEYAAYLLVGDTLSEEALSGPILVKTLKALPVHGEDTTVITTLNRQKGAIEVYRPKVTDKDGGIVRYVYEAVDRTGMVVRTIEIPSGGADIATFYVDGVHIKAGESYTFRVGYIFDDNEKEIEQSLGVSAPVEASGDSLPAITWQASADPGAADIAGDIVIHSGNSQITPPSVQTPIRLHIIADGIYEKEIYLSDESEITVGAAQMVIPIKEDALKQNTTYRVAVYAYVGGESSQLGYVTFSTRNLTKLAAKWEIPAKELYAVHRTLYLEAVDSAGNPLTDPELQKQAEIDTSTLNSLKFTLYRGRGVNKTVMATYEDRNQSGNYYESSLKEKYFDETNPVDIYEGVFGLSSGSLNNSMDYTLEVTAAYDYTQDRVQDANLSGYVNDFTIQNPDVGVVRSITPPDLPAPARADRALTVEELYNKDAAKYGGKKDAGLPDDAIVGYLLKPTYDNSSSLARTVTFYAYEAYAYKNAEVNQQVNVVLEDQYKEDSDPGSYCFAKTLEVAPTTDSMPSAIFMFGKGNDTYYEGIPVYFAGEANYNALNNELKGMERGYQYIFAYTVGYAPTGTGSAEKIYPFDHNDFESFTDASEYKVYNLNSGIQKAPRCTPVFYSYIRRNAPGTNGVIVRYRYTDGDNTIVYLGEGDTGNTPIQVKGVDGKSTLYHVDYIGGPKVWNDVTVPAMNYTGGKVEISPQVDCKIFEIRYHDEMPDIFDEEAAFYMSSYPYEKDDTAKYKNWMSSISVDLDTSSVDKNVLGFTLNKGSTTQAVFEEVIKRLVCMKATFTWTTSQGSHTGKETLTKYLFVDPNSYSASMSTSELEKFIGATEAEPIVVDFQFLFDGGGLGWDLISDAASYPTEVAIQKQTAVSVSENGNPRTTYRLGSYLIKNSVNNSLATSNWPANSIFTYDSAKGSIPEEFQLPSFLLRFSSPTGIGGAWTFERYYAYGRNGISQGYYSETNNKLTDYEIPKKIETFQVSRTEKMTLNSITPSVYMLQSNLAPVVDSVRIYGYRVDGFEPFFALGRAPEIRFEVYKRKNGKPDGNAVAVSDPITIVQGKREGYPEVWLKGLERNTDYGVVVKYRDGSGSDWITMMSGANLSQQIFVAFTTKSQVTVGLTAKPYAIDNNSYFDKTMKFTYTLSQTFDIRVEYELTDSSGKLIANAQQLEDAGMIDCYKPNQSYTYSMTPVMKIGNGTLMVPGKAYRVYIKVYNAADLEGKSPMNPTTYFTVSRDANEAPSVYFESVPDTHRINFYVTMADNSNTVMGRKYDISGTTSGIYKVRFYKVTPDGDVRVKTDYDDQLFYTKDKRNIFTLTDLESEQKYKMTVYSVVDRDEDGMNDNGPADEQGTHGWDYYYQGGTATDGSSVPGHDIAETESYAILSRVQTTLDDVGIYLGDVSIRDIPNQPLRMRMMLSEASGLGQITRMEYSITGNNAYTKNNTVIKSGSSIFTDVLTSNYSYYDFAETLPEGDAKYTIVVKLMVGQTEYKTLTLTYVKYK